MKIKETKKVEQSTTVAIQCDICKKQYTDILELQEFILIEEVGGYGSVIGDGTAYEVDICQHCFKEKLGQFLRTKEIWKQVQ
jgi:hypothetical protein